MKYPYTCKICNSHWDATSPNFQESHEASEAHRVKKLEADNVALLDTLKRIANTDADTFTGAADFIEWAQEIARATLPAIDTTNKES